MTRRIYFGRILEEPHPVRRYRALQMTPVRYPTKFTRDMTARRLSGAGNLRGLSVQREQTHRDVLRLAPFAFRAVQ